MLKETAGCLRTNPGRLIAAGSSIPEQTYLVTIATRDREPLFADRLAGRRVARELIMADVDTLAYVLMPDHLHWLIALRDVPLPLLIRRMKSCSVMSLNRHLRGVGDIWQSGYRDRAFHRDADVREAARYVVDNPLRAGLTDNILDYPLWGAPGYDLGT